MSSIVERVRLHQKKREEWEAEKALLKEKLSVLRGQAAAIELCRADMESRIKSMQKALGLPIQISLPTTPKEEPPSSEPPTPQPQPQPQPQDAPAPTQSQPEPQPVTPSETQPEPNPPPKAAEAPPAEPPQGTVKRKSKRVTKKKIATTVPTGTSVATFSYKLRQNVTLHVDCIRAVCFYPGQPVLVTGSDDGTLKVVNLEGKAASVMGKKRKAHTIAVTLASLRGHAAPVLSLASFERDGELMMISGALDGTVAVWTLPAISVSLYDTHGVCVHHRISEFNLHTDAVWGVDVLRDPSGAISCSSDGTAKLWTITTGEATTLAVDGKPITCKSLKDAQFAVGTASGAVHIFDGKNEIAKIATKCAVLRMTATEDGSRIVIASDDNHVRVIDVAAGEVTNEFEAHENGVTGVCVTGDGEFLITVGNDENVNAWSMSTFEKVDGVHVHASKYGEGGLCVAATGPKCPKLYFASGGAEGAVSVFTKA